LLDRRLLRLELVYVRDKLIKSLTLLALTSRKEKEAIKVKYVFIESNIINKILKDD